jgi:hypothetical protein
MREREFMVFKRLVTAVFVTAVTSVGVAAPADAAPGHQVGPVGSASQRAIDWE